MRDQILDAEGKNRDNPGEHGQAIVLSCEGMLARAILSHAPSLNCSACRAWRLLDYREGITDYCDPYMAFQENFSLGERVE